MAAPTGMTFDTREFDEAAQRMLKDAPDMAQEIVSATGQAVIAQAEYYAPKLTGFLRDQHGETSPPSRETIAAIKRSGDTHLLEGGIQHEGPKPGSTLYVNATYAAAVHENHPRLRGWFKTAIDAHTWPYMQRIARMVFAARQGGTK